MMRRKDENGFTLVELVISMGMFSIVMLAIMFFLTAGTKSYGHSKSELNLQMESQMLLNQIRDITYSSNYAKYDSTHKALILYDVDKVPAPTPSAGATAASVATAAPAPTKTAKVTIVYLVDDKLYLRKDLDPTAVDAASLTTTCVAMDDFLFSRYMQDFKATIKKNDVQLTMKMKNGKSKYELNEGITIRNGWITYP